MTEIVTKRMRAERRASQLYHHARRLRYLAKQTGDFITKARLLTEAALCDFDRKVVCSNLD